MLSEKVVQDITGLGGSIDTLREMISNLSEKNSDLEIALETAIDHGDSIEEQLFDLNKQLKMEITQRQQVELTLKKIVSSLSLQKDDLNLLIETITDHSDELDFLLFEQLYRARDDALTDALTGLANRRHFESYLRREWHRAIREKQSISLILMDIDYFKLYNDNYGHPAGDICIKSVATTIKKSCARATDLVARYGGEEFAVVLPNTNVDQATNVANIIQKNLATASITHEYSYVNEYVTLSIGVLSIIPTVTMTSLEFIIETDQLLYRSKQKGRNQIYNHQRESKSP